MPIKQGDMAGYGGGPRGPRPTGGGGGSRGMRTTTGSGRTTTSKPKGTVAKKTTVRKVLVSPVRVRTTRPGRKLYHGTQAKLKPGDKLRSGKKFGASATTRIDVAKDYADSRGALKVGGRKSTPRVYEVRTHGKLTGPQGKGRPGVGKSNTGEVNSNKPFRVVREVKPPTKTTSQLRKNARFN